MTKYENSFIVGNVLINVLAFYLYIVVNKTRKRQQITQHIFVGSLQFVRFGNFFLDKSDYAIIIK